MIDEKKIALGCWNGNVFSYKFIEDSDDEMDHEFGTHRPDSFWNQVPDVELDRLLNAFGWECEEGMTFWYADRNRFGASSEDFEDGE